MKNYYTFVELPSLFFIVFPVSTRLKQEYSNLSKIKINEMLKIGRAHV